MVKATNKSKSTAKKLPKLGIMVSMDNWPQGMQTSIICNGKDRLMPSEVPVEAISVLLQGLDYIRFMLMQNMYSRTMDEAARVAMQPQGEA